MHSPQTHFHLRYSPLLNWQGTARPLYVLQLGLVSLGMKKAIFLGHKETTLAKKLIQQLNKRATLFICYSMQIGFLLSYLQHPITLKVPAQQIRNLNSKNYQDILWSLVFCQNSAEFTQVLTQLSGDHDD